MDITIHHTIELGENALLVALIVLGLIALWMVYTTTTEPVLTPEPALPPEPPRTPAGFIQGR